MNTTDSTSGQLRHPSDEYGWPDLVMTLVVAVFGSAAVFAINSIPGIYGPHVGLVLSFVALMWLGFGFAQMPARWWGDLIIIGATLGSFFYVVRFRFQADWIIAALAVCPAAVSLFWGFSEGVTRLSEWERQRRIEGTMTDIIGTLIFSTIGALTLCGFAYIPYVGVILAVGLAFYLGVGLGWVELPVWSQVVTTLLSVSGFFFGLKWQPEPSAVSETGVVFGAFVGLCSFLFGFFRGANRAKRENERDGRSSNQDRDF